MNDSLLNPYIFIEINLETKKLIFNPVANIIFPNLSALRINHPIILSAVDYFSKASSSNKELFVLSRITTFLTHTYEQNIFYLTKEKTLQIYMHDVTEYKTSQTEKDDKTAEALLMQTEFLEAELLKKTQQADISQKSLYEILAVINIAGIGVWHWDTERDIANWNDCMYELFNVDKTFVPCLETFMSLVYEDDREFILDALRKCYEENVIYDVKFRIINKDNKIRYILARGKILFNSSQTPTRMMGICLDIT